MVSEQLGKKLENRSIERELSSDSYQRQLTSTEDQIYKGKENYKKNKHERIRCEKNSLKNFSCKNLNHYTTKEWTTIYEKRLQADEKSYFKNSEVDFKISGNVVPGNPNQRNISNSLENNKSWTSADDVKTHTSKYNLKKYSRSKDPRRSWFKSPEGKKVRNQVTQTYDLDEFGSKNKKYDEFQVNKTKKQIFQFNILNIN